MTRITYAVAEIWLRILKPRYKHIRIVCVFFSILGLALAIYHVIPSHKEHVVASSVRIEQICRLVTTCSIPSNISIWLTQLIWFVVELAIATVFYLALSVCLRGFSEFIRDRFLFAKWRQWLVSDRAVCKTNDARISSIDLAAGAVFFIIGVISAGCTFCTLDFGNWIWFEYSVDAFRGFHIFVLSMVVLFIDLVRMADKLYHNLHASVTATDCGL